MIHVTTRHISFGDPNAEVSAARTGHLPNLVEDLIVRLGKPSATTKDSDAIFSTAAVAHGKLRYLQGFTPAMLVYES